MTSNVTRGKPSAFTLVELLVVVTIATLLIAILLPALSRARYKARNVVCVMNLKQVAVGVTSYASDNAAHYPYCPSEETGYMVAPTVIALNSGASSFDWRQGLKPYFGGTLKGSWLCPLAPEQYSKGAVDYNNPGIDIDTANNPAIVTSYSHYFGRTSINNVNPPVANADTRWGSGAVYFTVKQGMKKIGDTERFDSAGTMYDNKDFRLISSDVVWFWNNMEWLHKTPGAVEEGQTYYREYYISNPASVTPQRVDYNYSTDDGAVRTLYSVGYLDPRVTATKELLRGWMLPLPE
ncbi:MAG: prepilin-type N-terminal cleavage/methylation domain-containing protein [Phycisphaera sp.]|nr:prepilin-type N-terminal cleavage/methylation domain-containing protein [Phycisphaera sp.]